MTASATAKEKRAKITKTTVGQLERGEILADSEIRGFVARRLPSGVISYGYRYRDRRTKKRRWLSLGLHGSITAEQARDFAKKRAGEVADRRDPLAEEKQARIEAINAKAAAEITVEKVIDEFLDRYVRRNKLRSAEEVERVFSRYIKPTIGGISVYQLKRSDVVKLLDGIEDAGAPVMADRVLAHLRKALNWHAARDDNFNSPIVRGMSRTKPRERARERVLSDDELRDLWKAVGTVAAPFPAIVRTLLLTAQRRDEVGQMQWPEIAGNTWVIPGGRYKTGIANLVPLTEVALSVIESLRPAKSRDADDERGPFVFSTTKGKKAFNGYSKAKRQLDDAMTKLRATAGREPMEEWVLHDLRRTARSLMSRAGVSSDIAERVLGHVIPGVRGVYDRHAYEAEKREALDALAALVKRILEPPKDNVVEFTRAG
jgi:integrase